MTLNSKRSLANRRWSLAATLCFGIGRLLLRRGWLGASIRWFRYAVEANRDAIRAWELLAWSLARARRREDAVDTYRALLAEHPRVATAWYQLGRLLQELKRPDEAVPALAEAIAIEPRAAAFHCQMAMCLESLDRIPEATASYERALRHDRGFVDAYRGLNRILLRLRQWERLRDLAKEWLEIAPSAEAAHALGTSLMMLNQFNDAKTALLRAHQLDPQSTDITADLAIALDETGQTGEAEALLRRALSSRSDDEALLEALAFVLLNSNRSEEALELAQAAIETNPTAGDTHAAAGSVLLQMGRPAEALSELDAALQLSPGAVEWHADRGAALNLLGRHAEAVAEFELLIDVDPAYFTRSERHPLLPYYEAAKKGQVAEVDTTTKQESSVPGDPHSSGEQDGR